MFSVERRTRVRDLLVAKAHADPGVVAAAAVGGSAGLAEDRWSDVDLSFAVDGSTTVEEVLATWTEDLRTDLDAAVLFDVQVLRSTYRVFLLPGTLQVDLSFTPAANFGPLGRRFELLFGIANNRTVPPGPTAGTILGTGIHHAVRAHICIARKRLWQAEFWISAVRDEALALACQLRGLEASHGRGVDLLPPWVLDSTTAALVTAVNGPELTRALAAAVSVLAQEAAAVPDTPAWVVPELVHLCSPKSGAAEPDHGANRHPASN